MLDHTADLTGARWSARAAVTALVMFAVADIFGCVLRMGEVEDEIIIRTHGTPDLYVAWAPYAILDSAFDYGGVGTVRTVMWTVALGAAVAAVLVWAMWLGWPRPARSVLVWLGITVVLKLVGVFYVAVALISRPVAYPLWTAATAALTVTTWLAVRAIRATDP